MADKADPSISTAIVASAAACADGQSPRGSSDGGTPTKEKTSKEVRTLCSILLGKVHNVTRNSSSDKLIFANMSRLAQIIDQLITDPDKIQPVEITIQGDDIKNFGSDSKAITLDENAPSFPDDIKHLGDIPVSWLWAVLRKKAQSPITDAVIKFWMKKSKKPFRCLFTYLTGHILYLN